MKYTFCLSHVAVAPAEPVAPVTPIKTEDGEERKKKKKKDKKVKLEQTQMETSLDSSAFADVDVSFQAKKNSI